MNLRYAIIEVSDYEKGTTMLVLLLLHLGIKIVSWKSSHNENSVETMFDICRKALKTVVC